MGYFSQPQLSFFSHFFIVSISTTSVVSADDVPEVFTVRWGTTIEPFFRQVPLSADYGSADNSNVDGVHPKAELAGGGGDRKNIVDWWIGNTNNQIVAEFNRSLAPLGIEHMWHMMQDQGGLYNEAAFFRVIPDFLVQFGIAASPEQNRRWQERIPDDPPNGVSNTLGTICYCSSQVNQQESRTTQIFVNLANNSHLDPSEYIVIGTIRSGLHLLTDHVNVPASEVNQDEYRIRGSEWLFSNFPNLNIITTTRITVGAASEKVLLKDNEREEEVSEHVHRQKKQDRRHDRQTVEREGEEERETEVNNEIPNNNEVMEHYEFFTCQD